MIRATPATMIPPATSCVGDDRLAEDQRAEEDGDHRVHERVGRDERQRRLPQDPGIGGEGDEAADREEVDERRRATRPRPRPDRRSAARRSRPTAPRARGSRRASAARSSGTGRAAGARRGPRRASPVAHAIGERISAATPAGWSDPSTAIPWPTRTTTPSMPMAIPTTATAGSRSPKTSRPRTPPRPASSRSGRRRSPTGWSARPTRPGPCRRPSAGCR